MVGDFAIASWLCEIGGCGVQDWREEAKGYLKIDFFFSSGY